MGRHRDSGSDTPLGTDRPSDAEIERRILSKIGMPVHFKYPGTEGSLRGVLKDRVLIKSSSNIAGVPYWDVVDLIEFARSPEPLWLRVGYYRYAGRLIWGSQTTLTSYLSDWRRLFVAARKRPWFSALLQE